MISPDNLIKISDWLWEIPRSFRRDMLVKARIYASRKMLAEIFRDRSLEQLINLTTLPGIQKYALALPDAHEGYGAPIGGVFATSVKTGIISPGAVGYDINCGVRLLRSALAWQEAKNYFEKLGAEIFKEVPSGVGRGGRLKLNDAELDEVFLKGAKKMIELGYGEKKDSAYLEAEGAMSGAEPQKVGIESRERGRDQLGTMGAGNHFVEVGRVEEIFEKEAASAFGLFENQVTVLIHTGSRGLGHQVATDYIKLMTRVMPRYKINLPDKELACAPFDSEEGRNYFGAMASAANFAWANRQLITWEIRRAWQNVLGKNAGGLEIVYDVAHNIAKAEEYGGEKLLVHRKGATRSFGPDHPEITPAYRKVGQPVIIPGSMGTSSYVLAGTERAMLETFGSSCHGAGRRMSRHAAKREIRGADLKIELEKQGIVVRAGSLSGLAEEAPFAYKDVSEVVEVMQKAGLAKKVARLRPLVVIKG